jgi:signal transduction histidine kinase
LEPLGATNAAAGSVAHATVTRESGADPANDLIGCDVAARTIVLAESEARHRDLAEVASDWLWETNADHYFTFVSKRFEETSGIPWSRIAGGAFGDLVELGFDRAGMEELRATIDVRGDFHDAVYRVASPGQPACFWRMSGKPFFDPATGAFAGYRGTGTNVTSRIERETVLKDAVRRAELAEQEAWRARTRLVDAIESIPEGFVLHDAEDKLVLCNSRYGEIYGLSEEQMTPGVSFESALRDTAKRGTYVPEGQSIDDWVAERMKRHHSIRHGHSLQQLANGRWLKVVERHTSDGGVVGIRVDVTEARHREAVEREREKLAALGHLAGSVAHEINNLLQPALTLPELVRDRLPAGDTESREDLDCVVESVRKVREIVRNILLFARREEPVLAKFDLVAEVGAALGFIRDLMPPSVTIHEGSLAAPSGCLVAANKTQLIQVLTNLLVNAAQAMHGTGSIAVSVARIELTAELATELSIDPGRAYLAVSVADTGDGMDEDTQRRVFEPFFTTKPVGQGTGLGLSVVHGILQSWHGAIAVSSAPGEGCTFTLYIPIAST